jgi:hypothetical protein
MSDPQDANVLCHFTVVVGGDGTPQVYESVPEGTKPFRTATMLDIRRALLEIAADLQARSSAEYVAQILSAPVESVPDRVSEALADRLSQE